MKQLMKATFAGTCLGLAMLTPLLFGVGITRVNAAYISINKPAFWAAHQWLYVQKLPPHGEFWWAVIPATMIIIQWTFIGLLIGSLFVVNEVPDGLRQGNEVAGTPSAQVSLLTISR